MIRRFALCLAIASLTFLSPRPAAAAVSLTFDTIDAVEIESPLYLKVTGIVVGGTTPTAYAIYMPNTGYRERCERFAVMMLSKPGKFQLEIIPQSGDHRCKLIRVTP